MGSLFDQMIVAHDMERQQVQSLLVEPLQAMLDDPKGLASGSRLYAAYNSMSHDFYEALSEFLSLEGEGANAMAARAHAKTQAKAAAKVGSAAMSAAASKVGTGFGFLSRMAQNKLGDLGATLPAPGPQNTRKGESVVRRGRRARTSAAQLPPRPPRAPRAATSARPPQASPARASTLRRRPRKRRSGARPWARAWAMRRARRCRASRMRGTRRCRTPRAACSASRTRSSRRATRWRRAPRLRPPPLPARAPLPAHLLSQATTSQPPSPDRPSPPRTAAAGTRPPPLRRPAPRCGCSTRRSAAACSWAGSWRTSSTRSTRSRTSSTAGGHCRPAWPRTPPHAPPSTIGRHRPRLRTPPGPPRPPGRVRWP